jgi:hypothetical protein
MLIKHELRENEKLLCQELIREVDSCIHYTRAMRSYRVGDVTNIYRVKMLVVAGTFDKYLQSNSLIELEEQTASTHFIYRTHRIAPI